MYIYIFQFIVSDRGHIPTYGGYMQLMCAPHVTSAQKGSHHELGFFSSKWDDRQRCSKAFKVDDR